MSRILCFFLGHRWKKYKRWSHPKRLSVEIVDWATDITTNDYTVPFGKLRQWKRCLRCPKKEVM